jgi:hypothetical protein
MMQRNREGDSGWHHPDPGDGWCSDDSLIENSCMVDFVEPCNFCGIWGHYNDTCARFVEPCNFCGIWGHYSNTCTQFVEPCNFCGIWGHYNDTCKQFKMLEQMNIMANQLKQMADSFERYAQKDEILANEIAEQEEEDFPRQGESSGDYLERSMAKMNQAVADMVERMAKKEKILANEIDELEKESVDFSKDEDEEDDVVVEVSIPAISVLPPVASSKTVNYIHKSPNRYIPGSIKGDAVIKEITTEMCKEYNAPELEPKVELTPLPNHFVENEEGEEIDELEPDSTFLPNKVLSSFESAVTKFDGGMNFLDPFIPIYKSLGESRSLFLLLMDVYVFPKTPPIILFSFLRNLVLVVDYSRFRPPKMLEDNINSLNLSLHALKKSELVVDELVMVIECPLGGFYCSTDLFVFPFEYPTLFTRCATIFDMFDYTRFRPPKQVESFDYFFFYCVMFARLDDYPFLLLENTKAWHDRHLFLDPG